MTASRSTLGSVLPQPRAPVDKHDLVGIRRLANQALVDLFSALGGNHWKNRNGWLTPGTDVRRWHGITVDAGNLVSLNLISNDLQGTIPRTISNLVTLTELNMSYNFGVVGVLPPEIGSMASLTVLHLYSAGVHGPIPEALGHLHSLQELWLNGNRLTGTIPARLGYLSQLRELYLNANELVGPIPRSFSELTNLEALNLSWNQLIGGFPSFLGNMVGLKLLVLEGNDHLGETCPAEHGSCLHQWLADKRAAFRSVPDGENEVVEAPTDQQQLDLVEAKCVEDSQAKVSQLCCAGEGCLDGSRKTPPTPTDLGPDRTPLRMGEEEERRLILRYLTSGSPPSLQDVLRDKVGEPFGLKAFRTFAAAHLMEENVDFWLEVERFKATDEDLLQELANDIKDRFVKRHAETEINLKDDVREGAMANMACFQLHDEACHTRDREDGVFARNIFDRAQRQIYDLLDTEGFPLFLQAIRAEMQDLVDGKATGIGRQETGGVVRFIMRNMEMYGKEPKSPWP